jgi:hypothetical protein
MDSYGPYAVTRFGEFFPRIFVISDDFEKNMYIFYIYYTYMGQNLDPEEYNNLMYH